jgi:hypothetical protein
MAIRRARVPLRMDQWALAGLGMRAQRVRGANAVRRWRGRALWSTQCANRFALTCFDRVYLKNFQLKCTLR